MNKIVNTFKQGIRKHKKVLFIIGVIVVIYALMNQGTNPQIQIPTQSLFGGAGGAGIAIGAVLLAIGIFLALSGVGTGLSPLFLVGAYALAGGALLESLETLLTSVQGLLIMGAGLLVLFLVFKK